jgi:hypothetical protein
MKKKLEMQELRNRTTSSQSKNNVTSQRSVKPFVNKGLEQNKKLTSIRTEMFMSDESLDLKHLAMRSPNKIYDSDML